MHHQGGENSKFQEKTEKVNPNRRRPRTKTSYNRDGSTMCTVDDLGRGGDSTSSGKVLIKQRRRIPKAGKSRSNLRRRSSSSSSSEPSSTSSTSSSQEEGIFGILLADEVNKENRHNMSTTPPTIGHGLISVIGRRRSMEDAFTVLPNLTWDDHKKRVASKEEEEEEDETSYDFFAVFDGHGGHKVSHKCKDRLHQIVAEEVARGGKRAAVDWKSVMASSFSRMDFEVGEGEVGGGTRSNTTKTVGSTALVVVIGTKEIVVANCGDCRVVLFRDGAALPLSRDHTPERPDEKERVEAAGGTVIEADCLRVLGVLSLSRSIGDFNLKPYIISEPEVQICERSESDDFLVIATDGLWDVMPNDIACDLVRKCFNGQVSKKVLEGVGGNCSAAAATMLAELAIARGSRDNISVIVVQLKNFNADTSSFTK